MPRALAIETSGQIGSVALIEEDGAIEEREFPHGLKHASGLIPLIDQLCSQRGWKAAQLEHVYVSAGPGSFTGLRIAITLAKTLAFATGVKLVAVPTMHVLVANAPPEAQHAIIVLDAKRDQIFTARFVRTDASWQEQEPARLDTLSAMLTRSPRPIHLIGEGILYHQQHIPSGADDIIITKPEAWRARASILAGIGAAMAAAGNFVDPYQLEPIYIRPPEAQEKLEAKQNPTSCNT
jgi:tRNA threonylcarbamoyladenosine biosynthesis protein TsaB